MIAKLGRYFIPLLIALAGMIGGGWMAAWQLDHGREEAVDRAAKSTDGGEPRSLHRTAAGAGQGAGAKRTYAAMKARFAEPGGKEEARQAVERMNGDELCALLLTASEPVWGPQKTAVDQLRMVAWQAAAEELFHREGMAAVEWADASGEKGTAYVLMQALCVADPIAGREHLKSYPSGYWGLLGSGFSQPVENAAAAHGARELLEVSKAWEDARLEYVPSFAPDFDFRMYLSEPKKYTYQDGPAVAAWSASDGEAAGNFLREKLAGGDRDWSEMLVQGLAGRANMVGEEEAARWACSLMSPYPTGDRDSTLRAIANDMTSARASAMVRNLPTDEDRERLGVFLLNGFRGNGAYETAALQAMESDDLRTGTLTSFVKQGAARGANAERTNEKAEKVMEQIGLPEEQRQKVRTEMGK